MTQNKRDRVKELKKEITWYQKAIKNMDEKDPKNFIGTRFEEPRKKQYQELLNEKAKLEKEKQTLEAASDYKWM